MATLKELAQRTGYAPATISRILSGDPALAVSDEARKRVLEEAGRLNYPATKSRRGRTPKHLLRLGMAEMLTPAQQLGDPYYLYLRNYVEQACLDRKYAILPLPRRGDRFALPERESVDGIVAIGLFTPIQVENLASLSTNLVFLDSNPDPSRFDSVVLNYELGISLALDCLFRLGHTHIGFIGPALKLNDRKEPAPEIRRLLFSHLMEDYGHTDTALLLEAPMEAGATAKAVAAFLASGHPRPTAFLTANEESAMGALRAFTSAGLRIPGDLSLISFNDTPLSALVTPALTSVSTHVEEMSRTAVRLLSERFPLTGGTPPRTLPLEVVVPPTLVLRETTGPH